MKSPFDKRVNLNFELTDIMGKAYLFLDSKWATEKLRCRMVL